MASFEKVFDMNFTVLRTIGLWTIKTNSKLKKWLYYFYQCFVILLYSLFVVLSCIDLYLRRHDTKIFILNLCVTVSVSLHLFKFSKSLQNLPIIEKLRKRMIKRAEEETDEECKKIIKKTMLEMKILTVTAFAMASFCMTFWCLVPLMDSKKKNWNLPFRQWFPFDVDISPNYEFTYAYQIISGYLIVFEFCGTDLVILFFMIELSSEFDILGKKIENLNELYEKGKEKIKGKEIKDNKDEKTTEIIKSVIKYHQEIISEIKEFEAAFNQTMFYHFFALTSLLVVLGLDLTLVTEIDTRFAAESIYLILALVLLFVYCYYGSRLEHKGSDIVYKVYSTPWFLMEKKFCTSLIFILARAQRIPSVTGGKFFPVNFETYLTVLTRFYDMLALFRQFFSKK